MWIYLLVLLILLVIHFPLISPCFYNNKKELFMATLDSLKLDEIFFYKNKFINIQIFSLTTVATTKKLENFLEK